MAFEEYSLDFQLEVLRLIYHDADFAAAISDTVTADHSSKSYFLTCFTSP